MDFSASLSLIVPEIVLSLSGLVLLLAAAWAGDKASSAISVLACIALGACFFLVAPAVCAGAVGPDTVAFYGQFRADAFAGFAKLLIYAASGAALVTLDEHLLGVRAETSVRIVTPREFRDLPSAPPASDTPPRG